MTLQEAYECLGLPRGAGPVEVKAAYRARVGDAHPDRGGDAATFIKIRAAYEILSAFLHEPTLDDEAPIPSDLRSVIDGVVRAFRDQQQWAQEETFRQMDVFEARMMSYVQLGFAQRTARVQRHLQELVGCIYWCIIFTMQYALRLYAPGIRGLVHRQHPGGLRRDVPQGTPPLRLATPLLGGLPGAGSDRRRARVGDRLGHVRRPLDFGRPDAWSRSDWRSWSIAGRPAGSAGAERGWSR